MAAIYDSGFELLPHAPYSPDLAPADFHLFPHLKKSLSGIHFRMEWVLLAGGVIYRERSDLPVGGRCGEGTDLKEEGCSMSPGQDPAV
ncbi:hypothetical protein LAZ67_9000821 [Cordylochernes scorpioides]|uniref:Histone-lysine N-methyltransferase SETMAR n=1 Tax=Cordylochernes scorpioides TaxID=51811 RepID=A0ABY6KT84_9ARAC|nr:hypothetical protein LAZ67_9000821 [Cordylochernes scorpioides]